MALTLSRPRAINCADCTIETPIDCDIPHDPSSTVPTALPRHGRPSSFTPHLFQYAVCQQMHKIMTLGVDKPHLKDYGIVKVINDHILSLMDDLPPVHRPHNPDTSWDEQCPYIPKQRQQITTAANSFLMALHRPHVGMYATSRQLALEAALNTLNAQERLFNQMGSRYSNIHALSFYTLDAGMFLAVTAAKYPPTVPYMLDLIHDALQRAIHRLEEAQGKVHVAKLGGHALKLCYHRMCNVTRTSDSRMSGEAVPIEFNITTQSQGSDTIVSSTGLSLNNPSPPPAPHPTLSTTSIHINQLESSIRFDDIIESQFDVESWMQQFNQFQYTGDSPGWI